MEGLEIHISDMKSFRGCRLRWHMASLLRLGLEPAVPNKHLWTGSLTHHALAGYYSVTESRAEAMENARKAWLKREAARLKELDLTKDNWEEVKWSISISRGMLRHYALWAPSHDDFEVILPETMLAVPLADVRPEGAHFVGTSDGLIRDPHGKHWLLEHKTAKSFPKPDALLHDEQSLAYVWAARNDPKLAKYEVQGTLFNFLRKKLPTPPRELKTGGLSRAQIDTTYECYLQALLDRGYPTTLYGALLRELKEKGNTFFFRMTVRPSEAALNIFEGYMKAIAKEMLNPNVLLWPHRTWWCEHSCPYREPCEAILNGLDPSPILNDGFRKRTPAPFDFDALEEAQ